MRKYKTITTVFFALVVMSITIPEAFAYHEDPGIDMQFTADPTIGQQVTIDCTKDNETKLNMLMTVFRYYDREVLASITSANLVVSYTLVPEDSSVIQIFCEYIDDKEDKVGYAVMRTFTPR